MKVKTSLSVVLAGYNEEKNVENAIKETWRVLNSSFEDWEIILVDDGSTDATGRIMKEWSERKQGIKFLSNVVNLNFGTSVLRGLYSAEKEYVIYNAMDLPLLPSDIPDIMRELEEEKVDCLVLERTGNKSVAWRKVCSMGNKLLLKLLFPTLSRGTPILNYIQIYRTEILKDIMPLARSPIFVWPELIFRVKLKGYSWRNRKTLCSVKKLRKGAFGKPHDIMWGVYEMLRFKIKISASKKDRTA